MAQVYKVLGQAAPGAAATVDVYTVPAATSTVVSTVVACNQGAATTIRISVAVAGAVAAGKQYLLYDTAIAANTTYTLTLGITLATTDVLRVYNTLATVSFNVFGSEIT